MIFNFGYNKMNIQSGNAFQNNTRLKNQKEGEKKKKKKEARMASYQYPQRQMFIQPSIVIHTRMANHKRPQRCLSKPCIVFHANITQTILMLEFRAKYSCEHKIKNKRNCVWPFN